MRAICAALVTVWIVGVATVLAGSLGAEDRVVRTVKEGIIDEARLYVEKLPASTSVVIRPFSATDEDIVEGEKKDETKKMQADGPKILADRFVEKLKELGPFATVSVVQAGATPPEGAVLVEGKFTELDPGSRAKRYFVGFGAGKSAVKVVGSIRMADGSMLAAFEQRRVGVIGAAGGDSMGKLVADTKNIGEDLAEFLSAWAKDKKLK